MKSVLWQGIDEQDHAFRAGTLRRERGIDHRLCPTAEYGMWRPGREDAFERSDSLPVGEELEAILLALEDGSLGAHAVESTDVGCREFRRDDENLVPAASDLGEKRPPQEL